MALLACSSRTWRPVFATVGRLLLPYYVGVSVYFYTDIMSAFFVLFGVAAYRGKKNWLAAVCFVLGISCRQYMIVFPGAIALFEFARCKPIRPKSVWLAPLIAAASLFGWIILFDGLVPPIAAATKSVSTAKLFRLFPDHVLYSLSCVGIYFILPETVLFWRDVSAPKLFLKRNLMIALALGVLFMLFPPLRNVDFSVTTMGFLDRGARLILPDFLRLTLFYFLALAACVRFNRYSLAALMVFMNALIMMKAHISWDKYALVLLVILWYMKATGTLAPLSDGEQHGNACGVDQ